MFTKKRKEKQFVLSPLNNPMVNYSSYYLSGFERIMYFTLTFVAGGIAGYVFLGNLFKNDGNATIATYIGNIVVVLIFGFICTTIFIPIITDNLKEKRNRKLKKQFLNMLDSIVVSLSSGNIVEKSFISARNDMKEQYGDSELIVKELEEINSGLANGFTLEEMLESFAIRSNNEDIQGFSNVMSNCYRLGGDFKAVVRKTRNIISEKMAIEEEIKTKMTSNKLQLNIMCLVPIALVGMLKLMNPSFADNLSSAIGVIATIVAIAIFIGAYFWGRKIVRRT